MSDGALLALHLGATAFMTGLIWFVQIVHYPLFAHVGKDAFTLYEQRHTALTTCVVAPGMLIELASAFWVLLRFPSSVIAIIGVVLLAVVWFSTAFVQVPCHTRLAQGFDERVARRLTRSNWIRTAAWSARSVLAALLVVHA